MVGALALAPEASRAAARDVRERSPLALSPGSLLQGGVNGLFGQLGGKLVKGELGEASQAAIAHISDLGRSFLQRFQESGATSGSLDLHLDIEALGLKVDGSGARSAEGHRLSVDMHVEATRGVIQTDQGELHFERIEMSFSVTETHVSLRESKPGGGKELLDGLKGLASLLDEATKGREGEEFGLNQIRELLAEQTEELEQLLEKIGRGFERLARRDESQLEIHSEMTEVQLEMLRFVRSAPPAAELPDATEASPA